MAKIKGNKALPVMVIAVIAIGIFVLMQVFKRDKTVNAPNTDANHIEEVADLSIDDLKVLGMEGDTEKDTIRTLVTTNKVLQQNIDAINARMKNLEDNNKQLNDKNIQLANGYNSNLKIQPRNNASLSGKTANNATDSSQESGIIDEFNKQVNQLSARLDKISNNMKSTVGSSSKTATNPPSNFAVGRTSLNGNTSEASGSFDDGVVWVMPDDMMIETKNTRETKSFSFPTSFNGQDPITAQKDKFKAKIGEKTSENKEMLSQPFYTLPVNSTLMGSVSMTALLGRIPIDGKVSDPYPFKIIIGRENLTANGIDLPHVEGAIVSGTSSGDYVLSCVRGSVRSITFVFDDGRIVTLPDGQGKTSSEDIGWLSDEYGIPCISGDIKSNAAQYLGTVMGLGTAAAAAEAFAQQNTTVMADGSNITTAVTGNNSQYILGKGLSGGIKETIDWFNKRYGQTFDAVYVPPGQNVAIHITKELAIDYQFKGRLVDYTNGMTSVGGLD